MTSVKTAIETLLEDATYGVKIYDDPGTAGSGVMTNETGIATGSPITLAHGANTPTITKEGTFTIVLPAGSIGTAVTGGWTVTDSPKALVEGSNTVTVQVGGAGTITINISTTGILMTGRVIDHWPGKSEFASYQWCITLGPIISGIADIASLGSFDKLYAESCQIDVWVMEKRGSTYTAEKARSDLVQEVDRCLLHFAASPGSGFMSINVSNWIEMDETGLKRSTMTAEMIYHKVRT
jgi:hypothetical protein